MTLFLTFVSVVLLCWKAVEAGYLEDVCMQPIDEGTACKTANPQLQYFFSTEREECIPFIYKGCGGNPNRYTLQDDCTDSCQIDWFKKKNKKKNKDDGEPPEIVSKEDCGLAPEPGPCKAIIKQWYMDKKSGKCQSFSYGGCKGNKNRFNNEAQCKAVCGK